MDIAAIFKSAFDGANIWSLLSGAVLGVLVFKLIDQIMFQILVKFFPEKLVVKLYDIVRKFDNDYLDKFKEKYPQTGAELESRLSKVFLTMAKIISDEE